MLDLARMGKEWCFFYNSEFWYYNVTWGEGQKNQWSTSIANAGEGEDRRVQRSVGSKGIYEMTKEKEMEEVRRQYDKSRVIDT